MLENQDIICVSSIDWDFIWQGNQEVMSAFADHKNRVLFIENTGIRTPTLKDIPRIWKRLSNWLLHPKGFRQVRKNLYVYSPLIVPFQYSRVARWVNKYFMLTPLRRWLKFMKFDHPIVWTFLPTSIALDIMNDSNGKLLVYYCAGDFDQLVKNGKKVRASEEILLKQCDLVFVLGEEFKKEWAKFNKNIFVFPYGVSLDSFDIAQKYCLPVELKDLPRPIIGYLGGIHRHIDFSFLQQVSEQFSSGSIVLVGPIQVDILPFRGLKNVHFTGQKQYLELGHYISHFDVCMIPYALSEYTKTVYPSKMHVYHAFGKPVVSTNLPEVVAFDREHLMYIAKTPHEFCEKIKMALEENDFKKVQARVDLAKEHVWSSRVEQMSQRIEEALWFKSKEMKKWGERFFIFYHKARFKFVKVAALAVFLWFVIFYTPLFWTIAAPLKHESILAKADAIVVFAGGVGEHGNIGQGYEERVHYAVELYKKGWAPYIVFSSGSRGTFSETFIMKALAVSLDVPKESIFLEEKAASTYQNVTFVNAILEKNGWDQIILVSSPYHMLRASLVFRKKASEKKVFYAPLPNSSFYKQGGRGEEGQRIWKYINMQQIKGILHEYTAIVYYWWKEYI